jgi:hypothetical protein
MHFIYLFFIGGMLVEPVILKAVLPLKRVGLVGTVGMEALETALVVLGELKVDLRRSNFGVDGNVVCGMDRSLRRLK